MIEDFGSRVAGPGEPVGNVDNNERLDGLGPSRSVGFFEGRSDLALSLASLDQLAIDRELWLVASEVSLERVGPRLAAFGKHQLPSLEEAQHSCLLGPRWVEAFFHKVKDLANYNERKAKLVRARQPWSPNHPTNPDNPEPPNPKRPPPPKRKGDGKGKDKEKEKEPG